MIAPAPGTVPEPPALGAPRLSVVVPTVGGPGRMTAFLDALARQTLPRERWELIVVFDGAAPPPALAAALDTHEARVVPTERNAGPGAARNHGAAAARGDFLVLTEDDVAPEPDWLACIAARLDADATLDVIEGVTRKPGGRPVRILAEEQGQYILCNVVVRRSLYLRVGGCHEAYFDAATRTFFREDTDLGWSLEAAGARVVRALDVVVVHPDEHPRFLDPLRWARRYLMDGLLAARFPERFRERIEVHRLGPIRIRRPIVRACLAYLVALATAAAAALAGRDRLAIALLVLAAIALLPLWAKWRFDPRRLPVIPAVPFVLALALVRGHLRARGLAARPVEPAVAETS